MKLFTLTNQTEFSSPIDLTRECLFFEFINPAYDQYTSGYYTAILEIEVTPKQFIDFLSLDKILKANVVRVINIRENK